MVTVKDFIEQNENQIIRISATPSKDEIGIMNDTIYEGMLYDIPKLFHNIEVIESGWLLGSQMHNFTVMKDDVYVSKYILEICKDVEALNDKLGEVIWEAISDDNISTAEMAEGVLAVFNECETEKEFDIANNMLQAICGMQIDNLILSSQINISDRKC